MFSDRSLRPLKVATNRFFGKQKFVKLWETLYRKLQIWAKLWKLLVEEYFFVKLQAVKLHLLQNRPQRKIKNFEIYCMLYCYSFSAVTAHSLEWLTHGKSSIKTKLNRLINSICFRVRSITMKKKYGNYSVKIHSEMYGIWYMKVHSVE